MTFWVSPDLWLCVSDQIVKDLNHHGWAAEAAYALHIRRIPLSGAGSGKTGYCWWHQEILQVSSSASLCTGLLLFLAVHFQCFRWFSSHAYWLNAADRNVEPCSSITLSAFRDCFHSAVLVPYSVFILSELFMWFSWWSWSQYSFLNANLVIILCVILISFKLFCSWHKLICGAQISSVLRNCTVNKFK